MYFPSCLLVFCLKLAFHWLEYAVVHLHSICFLSKFSYAASKYPLGLSNRCLTSTTSLDSLRGMWDFRDEMIRFQFFAFADSVVLAIKTRSHDRQRRSVTLWEKTILRSGIIDGKTDLIRFHGETGDSVHWPHWHPFTFSWNVCTLLVEGRRPQVNSASSRVVGKS